MLRLVTLSAYLMQTLELPQNGQDGSSGLILAQMSCLPPLSICEPSLALHLSLALHKLLVISKSILKG